MTQSIGPMNIWNSYSDKPVTGTHYLIGSSPRGPWHIAPGAFLDGDMPCRRYAARIVEHEGQLQILGFEDRGRDQFVGQIMDPEPVVANSDGTLYIPTSKGQAT